MQILVKFSRGRLLHSSRIAVANLGLILVVAQAAVAQPVSPAREPTKTSVDEDRESQTAKPSAALAFPEPVGGRRLSPMYPIWVDVKEKAVVVDGLVCLREGMLEMFACTKNTKEHEAIVAADTKAYLVHAALLSLGAEAGHPAKFQPKYEPPAGTEIDVLVQWRDSKGQMQTARAQDWIKDMRTKKAMTYPFVFGGSSFWINPENGKKTYQAEGGDFVCVSNFGSAMLDIPVKSSQSNEELEFEAFTEKIPPVNTPVRLMFKPKLKKQGAGGKERGAKSRIEKSPRKSEGKAESAGSKVESKSEGKAK